MKVIQQMLAVLFSLTLSTIKGTAQIRDVNPKCGQGKTTNFHCTAILGATPNKEDIEKNDRDLAIMPKLPDNKQKSC